MKKVLIVQKALPKYRLAFFNQLREKLSEENVQLELIFSSRDKKKALKMDEADLAWGKKVKAYSLNLGLMKLIWLPCVKDLFGKDLIISEQANRLLLNYLITAFRFITKTRFAYWGHGRDLQAPEKSLTNRFKRWFLRSPDWWFAYTSKVKDYLVDSHFPEERITVVQNAVDTKKLNQQFSSITEDQKEKLRKELMIEGENVAIYCGGIYREKRIDFLIEACDEIRNALKDFNLIVIGAGPEQEKIKTAAEKRSWIHYQGPLFDNDKVKYFSIAKVFLMPGLVGLAVLDAFTCLTPVITTDFPYHSPEIEYVESGINGIIASNSVEDYSAAIISYFKNEETSNSLKDGCKRSYEKYTMEEMVKNFSEGIFRCLEINSVN